MDIPIHPAFRHTKVDGKDYFSLEQSIVTLVMEKFDRHRLVDAEGEEVSGIFIYTEQGNLHICVEQELYGTFPIIISGDFGKATPFLPLSYVQGEKEQ